MKRIEKNKTGIDNKHFKPEQVVEALKDVKLWLFFFFSLLDNVSETNLASLQLENSAYTYFPPFADAEQSHESTCTDHKLLGIQHAPNSSAVDPERLC